MYTMIEVACGAYGSAGWCHDYNQYVVVVDVFDVVVDDDGSDDG